MNDRDELMDSMEPYVFASVIRRQVCALLEWSLLVYMQEAKYGDYVISGNSGEFYPCKPEIFEKTYEKTSDENE
jgi:hypothetical protein